MHNHPPRASILVPVYNQDVRHLVASLHQSALLWGGDFEIRVYDDGSTEAFRNLNASAMLLPGVESRVFPQNRGRAAIRNALINDARFEALVLLDADSELVNPDYIGLYMNAWDGEQVLCGGRAYDPKKPSDAAFFLHWRYGCRREARPAEQRNERPWFGFQTNNFVIPRKIARQVPFDYSLVKYGHEDTLFGLHLQQAGVPIEHIDNPLIHTGLERSDVFLLKHRQAIENLVSLYHRGTILSTRLMDAFLTVHSLGLQRFAGVVCRLTRSLQLANLRSRHPSLLLFDIYRLGLMLEIDQEQ